MPNNRGSEPLSVRAFLPSSARIAGRSCYGEWIRKEQAPPVTGKASTRKDQNGRMKKIGQFIPAFVIVLLMAPEASAVSIVAPTAGTVVSGAVSIRLQVGTKVSWTQLMVDHVPAGSGYNLIGWDSTSVPNGTHLVAVKTYARGRSSVLGSTGIYLVVRNGTSTHKTLVNPQN